MKTHKAIRFLMVAIVLFLQIMFLSMIVKEKHGADNFAILVLIILVLLTLFLGYRVLDLHHKEHSYEKGSVAVWVPIGAVVCYSLSISGGFGVVISAGITGTLASFIPAIKKQSDYLGKLPPAIYCGAFVGMSSVDVLPSLGAVIIAGSLAGAFYLLTKSLFVGLGGKLGTVAFGGVVFGCLINWLLA